VSLEKLVGSGWEDTGFFGLYSTYARLEDEDLENKPVTR
jgi:hypothetical protein